MILTHRSRRRRPLLSQDHHNRTIALSSSSAEAASALNPLQLSAEQGLNETEQALRQTLLELTQAAERASLAQHYPDALRLYEQVLTILQADLRLLPLPESLRMQGLAYLNAAWLQQQMAQFELALNQYTQALNLLKPLAILETEGLSASLMIVYRQRAQVYQALGYHAEAMQDLEQSLQFQLEALGQGPAQEELAQDWFNLALIQQELEQTQAALNSLQQARQSLSQTVVDQNNNLLLPILSQLAGLQIAEGQYQAARETYQQLLKTARSQSPRIWAQYALLQAAFFLKINDPATQQELDEIHATVLQLEHQHTDAYGLVEPLLSLADLCREQRLSEEALRFYTDAIRCAERSQVKRTLAFQEVLMRAYTGRANQLLEQGEANKALQAFRQAHRLAEGCVEALALAELDLQLGLCYQQVDKFEQAHSCFSQAIAVLVKQPPGEGSPDDPLIRALYLRGFLLVLHFDDVLSALQDFIAIEQYCPGLAAYDLACLYTRLGQLTQALHHLRLHLASPYALSQAEILADEDLLPLQLEPGWSELFC